MDRIQDLGHELRKWHNFHVLDKHIMKILTNAGIISDKSGVQCKFISRNTPDIIFCVHILAKDNNLGKDIIILIKPDHSNKRQLGVGIQVGKELKRYDEDDDKPKWSSKKVLRKEIHHAEQHIKKFFQHAT